VWKAVDITTQLGAARLLGHAQPGHELCAGVTHGAEKRGSMNFVSCRVRRGSGGSATSLRAPDATEPIIINPQSIRHLPTPPLTRRLRVASNLQQIQCFYIAEKNGTSGNQLTWVVFGGQVVTTAGWQVCAPVRHGCTRAVKLGPGCDSRLWRATLENHWDCFCTYSARICGGQD